MIQIINSAGLILQLDASTVIPVELNNPLFLDNNEFFQEITYSAETGLTDSNKLFIASGHLVDSPKSVFEFDIKAIISGDAFYAGTFSYKISNKRLSFLLKVNFGSVALKLKKIFVRDIMTMDQVDDANTLAKMEVLMKASCTNPKDYPFAFFPIHNDQWWDHEEANPLIYPWMNYWDHAAQKFSIHFKPASQDTHLNTLQVPFFKLSYVIKKIFEYLKFTLQGEILSDNDFNSLYIYTRKPIYQYFIYDSFSYLPAELTIFDFLQQICAREKLSLSFNVLSNTVTIENPIVALRQSDCVDLSAYVNNIEEYSVSEDKGYTITLKPDQTDQAMNSAPVDSDEEIYLPLQKLIVGDGSTAIELEISTLKQKVDTSYSYPQVKQKIDFVGEALSVPWPVRLIQYKGMKTLSDGKIFPEALSYDISKKDASWYQFLNDSKKVILISNLPTNVLSKLKSTSMIGFKSDEGTFATALSSKTSYSLSNSYLQRIKVKTEAYIKVNGYTTSYSIVANASASDENKPNIFGLRNAFLYKFCHEDGSMAPETLTITRIAKAGSPAVFVSVQAGAPANENGAGGGFGYTYSTNGNRSDAENSELRIYGKAAKYMRLAGIVYYFSQGDGYSYLTFPFSGANQDYFLLIYL